MSLATVAVNSGESREHTHAQQSRQKSAEDRNSDVESEDEELAEDDEGEGEGDEEDEQDDLEAVAIAQRLSAQLWADINKAQADPAPTTTGTPAQPDTPEHVESELHAKTQAALTTMKAILNYSDSDPLAHATLSSAAVPGHEDRNVLDTLKQFLIAGSITRDLAGPLSQILVVLAQSEVLFSPLPILPPQLQFKKRKRFGEFDTDAHPRKRQGVVNVQQFLLGQITEAVAAISQILTGTPAPDQPFDPSVVASIQLQLNQVFLFSMTSSSVPSSDTNALQEISALIQMLGVLSNVQITPGAPPTSCKGQFSLIYLFLIVFSQLLGHNNHRTHRSSLI